jgi:AraC-like DNA-binding protein
MTTRFRVPSVLPRRLEDLGVPLAAVLRHAALPPSIFRQEKVLVSTAELFALYAGIAAASSDPAIGLKLGSEGRAERYDPIVIAALSAQCCRDALQRLSKYKQLVCPEKIHVAERGGECTVRFEFLLAPGTEPPLLIDLCFAWIVNIARRGAGPDVHPKRVDFQRAAAHRELFEDHFRCPVKFNAGQNVLVFHKADMDRAFLTHNPEMLAIVAPQLEAELAGQLAQKTTGEQVKVVLKRLLAGRRPGMEDVARELRLSTRTLQRRLTGERASFQKLLAQARRELAHHYLRHSSLELTETAYLLGYEDANSFFRAFHHWEGTSPGDWRTHQQARAATKPAIA